MRIKLLLGLVSVFSVLCSAQVTPLPFNPVDAQYSDALDRVVMITANPNQLHVFDPGAGTDHTVALNAAPFAVSVGPDGKHAAVGTVNGAEYIDLQNYSKQTYATQISNGWIVLTNQAIIQMASPFSAATATINLQSGAINTGTNFDMTGPRYNSLLNAVYGTRDGESPNDVLRFAASLAAPPFLATDSPYHGDFDICGPVAFSPDNTLVYTGCSTIFHASNTASLDMLYAGSLHGLGRLSSIATSGPANAVAAVPYTGTFNTSQTAPNDSEVYLYDATSLNTKGHFLLAPFSSNSIEYPVHGHWVFFNHAGTAMYVVAEADSNSGLLNDFAIQRFALAPDTSCAVTLDLASLSVAGVGGYVGTGVTATSTCTYSAVSSTPWLVVSSNAEGSGKNTLRFLARPNLTGQPRKGTIRVGTSSLTVTQDAVPPSPGFVHLSFNPVASDFSKNQNRMAFVSTDPNELHLFDPITYADSIFPLPFAPLSVSVAPDGIHVAIGYDGWVSTLNLTTGVMETVYPVQTDVGSVLLPANGYVYVFPSRQWSDIYSIHLADGATQATNAIYTGRIPRLLPSGTEFVLAGGSWGPSVWDISTGKATQSGSGLSSNGALNIWLSEDGNRLFEDSGSVFRVPATPTQQFTPNGSLAAGTGINWVSESQTQSVIAALIGPNEQTGSSQNSPALSDSAQLQIYRDADLGLEGQTTLQKFSTGSVTYSSVGHYLTWNTADTMLYALLEADPAAGLLSPFAVETIAKPNSVSACSYTLTPSTFQVGPQSANVTANLTTNCSWKATTSSSFLYTQTSQGQGSGPIQIGIQNNTGHARSGDIAIGNAQLHVEQADAACTYKISPSSLPSFYSSGGMATLTVTAPAGCAWSASSSAAWISASGSSSTVTIQVAASGGQSYRSGSVYVAGQAIYVTQTNYLPPPMALRFVPVTPCRVADTRKAGGTGGSPIGAGNTRVFNIPQSVCNIPAAAQAYSLNFTVVPFEPLGYLSVWPAGSNQPLTSLLNSPDKRIKANAAIVRAGVNGGVAAFASNKTDLVIDINGYFVDASDPIALAYYPVTPCRVADTRGPQSEFGGPSLTGGVARDIPITASPCGIPATASAYVLNMTAVPRGSLGFVATWPAGSAQPLVSTLNDYTGTIVANAAIVPAGEGGKISVFASNKTDLVIDVSGYFAPAGAGTGLSLYASTPCRLADTRESPSVSQFSGAVQLPDLSYCGVPPNAGAAIFNATAIPHGRLGYVALWPDGVGQPLVSTLNAADGKLASNMAIVPSSDGLVNAFASSSADLVVDVFGYFAP